MTALPPTHIAIQQQSIGTARKTLSAELVADPSDAHSVGESAKVKQASRDFETVFLRQMLVALERTTKASDKGPAVAGQQAYGSMIVEAVADAVARSGGIGLGVLLERALTEKSAARQPSKSALEPTAQFQSASAAAEIHGEALPAGDSTDVARIFPQGLTVNAVPKNEIQMPAAQTTGQLADPRIR
jgi:Rod binding domain-containing protein